MAEPISSTPLFNTSRDSTATVSGNVAVLAGDLMVCKVISEDSTNVPGTPTTSGQTWRLDASTGAVEGREYARIYTTVAASSGNKTVSITTSNNPAYRAAMVNVWRGAKVAATPATNTTKTGSGAPSATVTTVANDSWVDSLCGDWNTASGARTYRSGAVEEDVRNNGAIQVEWFHQAAPTAGAQTIGLTAPGGQQWSMLGIEIQNDDTLDQTISPTAIAAPAAPGNPTLTNALPIRPATIPAPAAPGNPTLVPGIVYVQPATVPAPPAPGPPTMRMLVRPTTIAAPSAPEAPTLLRRDRPPLRVDWWALDDDGSILAPLPQPVSWDLSLIPGEAGAVQLEYPVDGINYEVLAERVTSRRDLRVKIRTDGTDANALGAILQSRDGDQIAESGTVTFTGSFNTWFLAEGRILYNEADPEGRGETRFAAATPGEIMAWFLDSVQGEGYYTDLWWLFDGDHDSAGTPWPNDMLVSPTFPAGKTLLEVAQQLRGWGLCEFEVTTALEVRLYVPETVGVDHTLKDPPIVLRRGRDLLEAPRRTDVRSAITDLIVVGKDGVHTSLTNPTAVAERGRKIVGYLSEGNAADLGSATVVGQAELDRTSHGIDEGTHTLTFDQNHPTPLREMWPADWVYADTGSGLGDGRLRIAQMTVSQKAGDDSYSGGVVLGDLIDDRDAHLQRQIDKLKSGSTIPGTSEPPTSDGIAPAAPTGVVTDSIAYSDGPDTYATVLVDWAPVTLNEDGSAATDIAGYRVQWRLADDLSGAWIVGMDGPATSATFGGVAAGVDVFVRVACYDRDGNQSAWTTVTELTETDQTPPPVPSAPTVSSMLGVLMAEWNGKGSAGEAMPADFAYVEVHVSITSNFTPDATTYYDRLFGAGTMPIPKPDDVTVSDWYSVARFVRLVAVDMTTPVANRSAPGGQGSATASKVVSDDIFAGAVGSAQLADLAVTTAKINLLAVNDAQVGNLSVGKLTAGTFSAALTLSGIFRTGVSGARGEWDSTSFRQYDSTGTQVLGFVPGGVSFMTGEFRTALSKQRMVINPGGTVPDEIRVFPSGGGDYARIMSRTAPGDGSAAVLIDGGATGSTGRGRLGAYRAEAFVSYVTGDAGGDTSAGYSRTAVTCSNNQIGSWAQTEMWLDKVTGSTRENGSRYRFTWTAGTGGDQAPTLLRENDQAGIKLDPAGVVITNTGTDYGTLHYGTLVSHSSIATKQDVRDLDSDPLAVVLDAPSKQWRYRSDVGRLGEAAPVHLGPIAEDLPASLHRAMPDGAIGLDTDDKVGLLWAAVHALILRLPESSQPDDPAVWRKEMIMSLAKFYGGQFLTPAQCAEWDGSNEADLLDWFNVDGIWGSPTPPQWSIASVTASQVAFTNSVDSRVVTMALGAWVAAKNGYVTVINPAGKWKTSDPYGRPENLVDIEAP